MQRMSPVKCEPCLLFSQTIQVAQTSYWSSCELFVCSFSQIAHMTFNIHGSESVFELKNARRKDADANVKSRIELNKWLHYTPLVPLIVLTLLVRSPLSYTQIKSLFS